MDPPAGLYIHVPFCRARCPFCDFAITTDLDGIEAWREALGREMARRAAAWRLPFDTVYLGGGTPSLLGAERTASVLAAARRSFAVAADSEVTLEANPGTLAAGDCRRLLESGVNRLSLGVQSLDDEALRFLGRDHTAADSRETFRRAREEGFTNISIDLIYALPGRSPGSWEEDLRAAAALAPEHVSAYQLTFEPGTPLGRRRDRSEIREVPEEEARTLFLRTREVLEDEGYVQYEVSSFARSGVGTGGGRFESRHNSKYWQGAPYLGLGPSAHSYRDGVRSWNIRAPRAYAEAAAAGRDPEAGREVLSEGDRRLERLALALRTARGLRLDRLREEVGADLRLTHGEVLRALAAEGLLVLEGETLRPTAAGLALADAVALRLASDG